MSPLAEQIAKKVLKIGAEYAKAQLKKDAANRYSLTEQWILPLVDFDELPPGEFHDEVVHIVADGARVMVWLDPYDNSQAVECDGASLVPDVLLWIDLRPGALAHDPIYRRQEKIAQAFGVKESVVRKFADAVFTSVTQAENAGRPGCKTVSTIAHWAIRLFGGIYHKTKKSAKAAAIVALAAICLGGCAGCVQTSFENPGDYVSPKWEKTA
jgi:hypothetical protein